MSTDTRSRILAAALDSFCEHGYSACVDDIARRPGVVKQTLYHHYDSKDNLFREALMGLVGELLVELKGNSGSVRKDLLKFAKAFITKLSSEQGLAFHRMLVAESPRFPELASVVHESWSKTASELARLLRTAMQRGELLSEDPDFAAEVLLSMLKGTWRDQLLLGLKRQLPAGHAARVVQTFLRAYAPEHASVAALARISD